MQVFISVKNFGKIKSARINISNFTIFVGNNNSGKTYLMQLIYGVINNIKLNKENIILTKPIIDKIYTEKNFILTNEIIKLLQNDINSYLYKNKNNIVYNVFRKEIDIDELNIEFVDYEDQYEIRYFTMEDKSFFMDELNNKWRDADKFELIDVVSKMDNRLGDFYGLISYNLKSNEVNNWQISISASKGIEDVSIIGFILDNIIPYSAKNKLFIPASRTGLLLLYREFFAKKADKYVYNSSEVINNREYMGLTKPVYDFLRFLQTVNTVESTKKYRKIIHFIENNLIDGHLNIVDDKPISYTPINSKDSIPLYLTSSMINELTPIIKALYAQESNYFIWDEIETSLHPAKQREMARLLNRMNNAGIGLIVSTHSDTMATKINNLLLLSYAKISKEHKKKILSELNLSEDDLLKSKNVHVYQFINGSDGRSTAEELKFNKVPYIGYDFSLFNENVLNLYEESKIILGLNDEQN